MSVEKRRCVECVELEDEHRPKDALFYCSTLGYAMVAIACALYLPRLPLTLLQVALSLCIVTLGAVICWRVKMVVTNNALGVPFWFFPDEGGTMHRHKHSPTLNALSSPDKPGRYLAGRDAEGKPFLVSKTTIVLRVYLGGWWLRSGIEGGGSDHWRWRMMHSWDGRLLFRDRDTGCEFGFSVRESFWTRSLDVLQHAHYPIGDLQRGTVFLGVLLDFLPSKLRETTSDLGRSKHAYLLRLFLESIRDRDQWRDYDDPMLLLEWRWNAALDHVKRGNIA